LQEKLDKILIRAGKKILENFNLADFMLNAKLKSCEDKTRANCKQYQQDDNWSCKSCWSLILLCAFCNIFGRLIAFLSNF
jgi:hypothetical protein